MEQSPSALVFDSSSSVRNLIREALEERGVMTLGAASSAEAVEHISGHGISLLFVDLDSAAPPLAGLMARASALTPKPFIIGLHSTENEAELLSSLDAGVADLLRKPIAEGMLGYRIERALRHLELMRASERLRLELQSREGFSGFVGRSAQISRIRERIEGLAPSDTRIWFSGEPGSGKQLAARTLHAHSPRAPQPFEIIDCEGDPAAMESLWSDSQVERSGTIYLAQAASMPLEIQDRLTALLESLPRPGADGSLLPSAGPRFLAGAAVDPRDAVAQGRLLPDLSKALAEVSLLLPPLRKRGGDVALLARFFVTTIAGINQLPPIRLSEEALELLEIYPWPGNVLELRNAIEKAVILAVGGNIQAHDLPRKIREYTSAGQAGGDSLSERNFKDAKQEVVSGFERAYLTELMQRFRGNVTGAARHAGMLRSALQRLLRKHGMKSVDFRSTREPATSRRSPEKSVE
jgi:two-component system nitrogen regulation response regulator NtrX